MIVYANYVPVRSGEGLVEPLRPVAEWLSRKMKKRITPEAVLGGIELRSAQNWIVKSRSTTTAHPHLAAVELIHPDTAVAGRQWHSEIGLRQRSPSADVELSVLVHTSEVSARVVTPVVPGAPAFVGDLLTKCVLSSDAIGGEWKPLDDGDAEGFRHVVLDATRRHPFVVVSPERDGSYALDLPLLQQLLIGLAELVVIPPTADTFWLARGVGEEYVPYRGAVKIIHTPRAGGRSDVRTFTSSDLATFGDARQASRELFSWVLHRTNLPVSWRHVSPAHVREEQLRRELDVQRAEAATSGDAAKYISFLEEYVREQEAATQSATESKLLAEQRCDELVSAADQSRRELESKVEALKYQLDQASAAQDDSPYRGDDIERVATVVAKAVDGEPTPEQCLIILSHFFPTRVKILPEAWTSSRESESFRFGGKLFSLMFALVTEYWEALASGKPDQEARKVFGNAYAARESESVSTNKGAKRRRTFVYEGEEHVMEKHLKIGVKDSATETLRVHFEWFADVRRIVIGHCGPHINFS